MNKIFKVVWSKSKECYVVVSEIAKNNGGKKKVLASVFAGLAAAGVMGGVAPQVANATVDTGGIINVYADSTTTPSISVGNNVTTGSNSVGVGNNVNSNNTDAVAIGHNAGKVSGRDTAGNNQYNASNVGDYTVMIGSSSTAGGARSVAIGNSSLVKSGDDNSVAIGNLTTSAGTAGRNVVIGNGSSITNTTVNGGTTVGSSVAIGNQAKTDQSQNIVIGYKAQAMESGDRTANVGNNVVMGTSAKVSVERRNGYADIGAWKAVAIGNESFGSANAVAVGDNARAERYAGVAIGRNALATTTDGGNSEYNTAVNYGSYNNPDNKHFRQISYSGNTRTLTEEQSGNNYTIANGTNQERNASGVSIGPDTKAYNFGVTLGNNSYSDQSSVSIGNYNEASGVSAIAMGVNTRASGNFSQAYGRQASAVTQGSLAMGALARGGQSSDATAADKGGSVALGTAAWATGNQSIAIGGIVGSADNLNSPTGPSTAFNSDNTVKYRATGVNTQATGEQSVAIGTATRVGANNSVALGRGATVVATDTTGTVQRRNGQGVMETYTLETADAPRRADGRVNTADPTYDPNKIYNVGSNTAIGANAYTEGKTGNSVALGDNARVKDGSYNALAIGSGASTTAYNSLALGTVAQSNAYNSIAVGASTLASGEASQAFGDAANATALHSLALGSGAQAKTQGSVAIGSLSVTEARTGQGESTAYYAANRREYQGQQKDTLNQRDFNAGIFHTDSVNAKVYTDNSGVVSVGNDLNKRQIINVAGGTNDFDAVNVAQLKNVSVAVAGNTGDSNFLVHSATLKVEGAGRISTAAANDGNDSKITVSFDATDLVKAGDGVTVTPSTTTDGKTSFTVAAKNKLVDGTNTTVEGDGSTATPYKVNVKGDLAGITSVTGNTGSGKITFTTPNTANGNVGTTINGGNLSLGDGTTNNRIVNLAPGVNGTDAVNVNQLNAVKASELHIRPTTTNITGESARTTAYKYDKATSSITLEYNDGNGANKSGTEAKIDLSDVANSDLSNITNDGKKNITKLGSIVKAGDNVNVTSTSDPTTGQTTYTVNAVTPVVYTDKQGNKVYQQPNGTFTKNADGTGGSVAAGDVIASFQDGNKTTTGGNMIVNNIGSAINNQTGGDFLTKLDNANTATPNAAVNVSDLKSTSDALTNKGLRFDANSGGEKTNKLGSKVTVQGTGTAADTEYNTANIKTTITQTGDDTTINIGLAKALTGINSITNGNSSITLNPAGGTTIAGGDVNVSNNKITNLAPGTNGTDAVNVNQLKSTEQHIAPQTYTVNAGDKTVTMTYVDGNGQQVKDGTGAPITAKIDLSNLPTGDMSSFNVTSSADTTNGGTHAGATSQEIKDGKSVDFQAGKNITVTQTNDGAGNTVINTALSKDIEVETLKVTGPAGKDGSIGINGKDGVTRNITVEVPGQAGQPGTPGVDGTTTTRIVFDGKPQANLDDGLKFGGDMGTVAPVKLNKQVDVKGGITNAADLSTGQNIGVTSVPDTVNGGATLNVQLAKNLTNLTSVGGDTNSGKITFQDPNGTGNNGNAIKISGGNVSVDGNKITNVGPGTNGTDAVNVDQLNAAKYSFKTNAAANGGTLSGTAAATAVAKDATVTYAAGQNLTVKQDLNATTGDQTYTYSLNRDLDIDAVVINGKNGQDGAVGLKGADGVTRNISITTAGKDGLDGTPGANGTTRIVYDDGGNKQEVANLNDGLRFTGNNTGTENKQKLNSLVKVQGEGTKAGTDATGAEEIQNPDGTKFESATGNIAVEANGTDTLTVKLNKNLSGLNSVQTKTIELGDPGNTTTIAKDGDRITYTTNNGGTTVTNKVANLSDEWHIAPTVTGKAGENVGGSAVTPSTTAATAGAATQAYTYNTQTKQVELTFNDGNGNAVAGTKAVIDLSNLPTGGSMDSFNVKSSATTGTLDAASATTAAVIDNNKTVEFQAGKNLTIKQTNDTDGAKVEYSLNKDLEIETIKVTGPAGKDGSIGINGKDGVTRNITIEVPGQPGQPGTPGVDGTTTTRIVFDGKPQANLDDGLKFGGDMGTVAPVKLNKQVDVKGGITTAADLSTGNNIGVTSVPDAATGNATLNVQLAKNLTNLTSVGGDTNSGKITFQNPTDTGNNGDAVKISGGNVNVDGNKITNVQAGTNDTDAVNVKQLKDGERYITPGTYTVGDKTNNPNAKADDVTMTYTDGNGNIVKDAATNQPITATISGVAKSDLSNITNDGIKKITGLGTIVKAGDNVTVTSTEDANTGRTTYTVNAVTPAVYTKADGTKVYKQPDGSWNTQADGNGTVVQPNEIIASFETPGNATTPGSTTGGTMIVNNIGSAIKNAGNAGDSFLTRLDAANTATPNAAVNVSDLKSTSDALRSNELHIRPTTTDINGEQAKATSYVYDTNTKSVTLEYNDGNGQNKAGTVAKIDLSGLANQITSGYTFSTNAKADGGAVEGTPAVTTVDNGGTVTYAAGKNLTVKQDVNAANKEYTYTYSLSDDITIGKNGTNGVDGKIGVNGKDGSAVVINGKDGSIGLNGANGQNGISIKGDKGVDGVDGANGANGITRIVYTDDNNNRREVATMDDGLRFTGNNTSTENKNKLNSLVTIKGEGTTEGTDAAGAKEIQNPDGTKFESATGNIAVEADGNSTLTVKLNKNVKGLDSVQTKEIKLIDPNGGNDMSIKKDGDRITYNNGGNNKTIATTDDIWKIQANGTTVEPVNGLVNVKAGDNVSITSDAATGSMTINAVTPAVYTTKDGTKVYRVVDPTTGNVTWNTNPNGGTATEVQPGDVITSFETPGTATTPSSTTGGTMIINNAGSAIKDHATPGVTTPTFLDKLDAAAGDNNTKNAVVNVTDLKSTADALTDKGLRFDANSGGEQTNKLGSKVTVKGTGAKADADYVTDNIKTIISQDAAGDTTINIGLAKDLTGVNSITNTVGGPTLTFGPTSLNVTGGNLNLGGNKITNLAPATNDDDAVNYKQLKDSRTVVTSTDGSVTVTPNTVGDKTTYDLHVTPSAGTTSTWTAKSSAQDTTAGSEVGKHVGDSTQVIADGKSVDFQAGKNIVITQTNDANGNTVINTALADNITAGKDGVNGVDGSIGATGKDGSSVVINGKDGSIGLTGPKGQDGKDGINGRNGANVSFTSAEGNQTLVNRDPNASADTDKAARIVYVPKDAAGNPIKDGNGNNIVREVATMDDGLKFTGNNISTENKAPMNSLVTIKGEGTTEGTDAAGAKEIQNPDGTKFESATGNIAVEADGNSTLTVKLNKNVKGLDSVQTKEIKLVDPANNSETSIKKDGDRITYTTTDPANPGTTVTKKVANTDDELHITPTTFTAANDGTVTMSYTDGNGNIVTGKQATIKGLAINNDILLGADGSTTTTTLKLNNAGGIRFNVLGDASGTAGANQYINTRANGSDINVDLTQAAKDKLNKTYTVSGGANVTVTPTTVGDNTDYRIDVTTTGGAASTWNVKSSGNTTADSETTAKTINDTNTVEMVAGNNLTVKQTSDATGAKVEFALSDNIRAGKDGVNGVDGSIGATGKDGNSVVLNGKDGTIGIDGKDGRPGVNGRDGANIDLTTAQGEQTLVNRDPNKAGDNDTAARIVYVPKDAAGNPIKDGNGNNIVREVATMDDGLRFTGNNTGTENKQKMNSLVKVQGEGVTAAESATFTSASGNINVKADGTDTLEIQLNKNLKNITSIQNGGNSGKITFNDPATNNGTGVTISGGNVSVDNNQIKNVKDGVDGTDAVNVNQMKANRTTVTSSDGSISVTDTNTDPNKGHAYDIKINNQRVVENAQTPVVYTNNAGDKVYKMGDGTFNTKADGTGTTVQPGDVIASMNNGNGSTTNPMVLNNVGSAINNQGGTTYLDKLNNANATTPNAAVNVSDLKNTADQLKAEERHIAPGTYNVDNNGNVTMTYVDGNGNPVNGTAVISGVAKNDLSNITNDGKKVITGLGTVVKAGTNVTVNESTDATTGRTTYTVNADLSGVAAKSQGIEIGQSGTGKAVDNNAGNNTVSKGTQFSAGNNITVTRDAVAGNNNIDHNITYALNSDLKDITSITGGNNSGSINFQDATANNGDGIKISGGNVNMGGNSITNLKPGTNKTDAATVGQMTQVTSNDKSVKIVESTNADGAKVYDLAVQGNGADPRIDHLSEEIGRVGAQGAALAALKPIQYDPLEPTQIMAGYGNYRGNSALALGVAHYKNESTMIHGGVSWAGGSSHMMANAGVTWKIGNRDSEEAVADRYRKGPISSAYTMQSEMAAMKAQNAGLKGEVADLKAENEQMKAQIAAMMAKLGL